MDTINPKQENNKSFFRERWGLVLRGLTKLSDAAAESLSKYKGMLWLDRHASGFSPAGELQSKGRRLQGRLSLPIA